MKAIKIFKKRDGQNFKEIGEMWGCETFEEAKIEFAKRCYNDLLNGKHGDNFIELSKEEDGVEEDGIYDNGQLFFSKKDLKNGIERFSEDVYHWEIRQIEEQIGKVQLNSYAFPTEELHKLVEIRVYVVDTDNYEFDTSPKTWDDEKFMNEAEIQGKVYTLQGFQEAFNLEEITSAIDVIRIINVPFFDL
jgi:hypothetical protein